MDTHANLHLIGRQFGLELSARYSAVFQRRSHGGQVGGGGSQSFSKHSDVPAISGKMACDLVNKNGSCQTSSSGLLVDGNVVANGHQFGVVVISGPQLLGGHSKVDHIASVVHDDNDGAPLRLDGIDSGNDLFGGR